MKAIRIKEETFKKAEKVFLKNKGLTQTKPGAMLDQILTEYAEDKNVDL